MELSGARRKAGNKEVNTGRQKSCKYIRRMIVLIVWLKKGHGKR
jgi:hypothetical protein